jgi:hypothetical protein
MEPFNYRICRGNDIRSHLHFTIHKTFSGVHSLVTLASGITKHKLWFVTGLHASSPFSSVQHPSTSLRSSLVFPMSAEALPHSGELSGT